MHTTSIVYNSNGVHLGSSMDNGVVAPGSQRRKFKKGQLVVVLDVLSSHDEAWVALAWAKGELETTSYATFWPNWSPKNPSKVTVSKVKFITGRHRIQKAVYGTLTQTNIKNVNLGGVVSYVQQQEAQQAGAEEEVEAEEEAETEGEVGAGGDGGGDGGDGGEAMAAAEGAEAARVEVERLAQEDMPPLHEIVVKLRTELGLPEMPMAQLVDRAVFELSLDVGKTAGVLEKASAAWRAL